MTALDAIDDGARCNSVEMEVGTTPNEQATHELATHELKK
jgi:hypothetical protein